MVTTHQAQTMTDIEFHEMIAEAYYMVRLWDSYINAHRNTINSLPDFGLKTYYKDTLEIQRAARDRVKRWIRKQVLLRYNCK